MKENLMLADPSTGRISKTCNQRTKRPIGALHYRTITVNLFRYVDRYSDIISFKWTRHN
jgi:hypothetical protein